MAHLRIGFPPGVINVVTGRGEGAGQALLENKSINKYAFTGSGAVGRHIYKEGADRMVRLGLELGGKSPTIVMPDADIAAHAPSIAMSAFGNTGQICASGSKVIAHISIAERLAEALAGVAGALPIGAELADGSVIGPVCSKAQFDRVMGYIKLGASQGRVIAGGEAIEGMGYFVKPTIIVDIKHA